MTETEAKEPFPRNRGHLFLLILGILSFLIAASFIAFSLYSGKRLRKAEEEQWMVELASRARVLGYFLEERCYDLQALAESSEVQSFFANKALGMSLQYGLQESLQNLLALLKRYRDNRTVKGEPIYREFFFFQAGDTNILYSSCGEVWSKPEVKAFLSGDSSCGMEEIPFFKEQGTSFAVFSPIFFKSQVAGWIVACLNEEVLFEDFLGFGDSQSSGFLVLSEGDHLLFLPRGVTEEELRDFLGVSSERIRAFPMLQSSFSEKEKTSITSFFNLSPAFMMAASMEVPRTSFTLHWVRPEKSLYGSFSAQIFIVAVGTLMLLVWWGLFHAFSANENRRVLEIDLREREASEKALKEAKRQAEDASRMKSEFIANVSHEIRTPMNSIIGMTELLLSSSLSENQKDYALTVQKSGEELLGLINDILDISKIEAGMLHIEENVFEFQDVLEGVRSICNPLAAKKNLQFHCLLDPDISGFFRGDPSRLRQVLLNLVSNAIKFTSQGYVRLQIRVRSFQEDSLLLEFLVEDTGMGIGEEKQALIFLPFHQGDGSMSRKYGGTGLGLTISREIVRIMGGELWVSSIPGRGSTFGFSCFFERSAPRERKKEESPELPENFTLPPSGDHIWRILLVEDNRFNQKLVLKLLERWGIQADLAENGLEALEKTDSGVYDLILMDVQMPEMDGLEATREIRKREAQRGLSPTPVVAMTANAYAEDREKCFAAGMNDYLAKPVKKNNFYGVIAKFLKFEVE